MVEFHWSVFLFFFNCKLIKLFKMHKLNVVFTFEYFCSTGRIEYVKGAVCKTVTSSGQILECSTRSFIYRRTWRVWLEIERVVVFNGPDLNYAKKLKQQAAFCWHPLMPAISWCYHHHENPQWAFCVTVMGGPNETKYKITI